MKKKWNTNPGSEAAIKKGCECPVLDNAHGKGAYGTFKSPSRHKLFWINAECPIHGRKDQQDAR